MLLSYLLLLSHIAKALVIGEVASTPTSTDLSDQLLRYRFHKVGPFGDTHGNGEYDPSNSLPHGMKLVSIRCRGRTRLNYLEINYSRFGTPVPYQLKFGDPAAGIDQGFARLDGTDRLFALTPFICTRGWFKGDVCGLKLEFGNRQPLQCGIDDSAGNAVVPAVIQRAGGRYNIETGVFYTFTADTVDHGRVITRLGWTLKTG